MLGRLVLAVGGAAWSKGVTGNENAMAPNGYNVAGLAAFHDEAVAASVHELRAAAPDTVWVLDGVVPDRMHHVPPPQRLDAPEVPISNAVPSPGPST